MADTEKNGAEKTGAEKNGAKKNGAEKNGAEKNGAEKNDAEGSIPASDAGFLLACLQNVSGGSIAVSSMSTTFALLSNSITTFTTVLPLSLFSNGGLGELSFGH